MKKVAAVFKLTQGLFRKFSDRGVTDIFYYEIDEDLYENYKEGSNSINLINVSGYRVPGTWKTLQYIDAVLKKIVKKSPDIFHVNGYDTYNALLKELYWSNFRVGSLYYAIEQLKGDYKIEYCQPYFKANYVKELLKWFRNSYQLWNKSFILSKSSKNSIKSKYKIGFLIGSDFVFNLYENLLSRFKSNEIVLFLNTKLSDTNCFKIKEFGFTCIYLDELNFSQKASVLINPFLHGGIELEFLNVFLKSYQKFAKSISHYLFIKEFNLETIVVNEAENIPELLILKSVLNKSTRVINTMNGAKAGEAHDSVLNIDEWFVWDDFMKDFMYENGVPSAIRLLPLGHLSSDNAINHNYSNSLNINIDLKKIIVSVFSVNDHRPEKQKLVKLIDKILNEYPDKFIFLYREHPTEKSKIKLPQSKNFLKINYNQSNSKVTLYDQLYISDLSIVYGSTVAIESTWFKVPCITFEVNEISILPFVDNKYIRHINNISLLEILINKQEKITKSPVDKFEEVSSKYYNYLIKISNDLA